MFYEQFAGAFSEGGSSQVLFGLALALFMGLLLSRFAKPLGLPAVTGYLIAGVLIGPYGLFYPRREVLYERINRRVDIMMADGLLEETRGLLEEGVFDINLTAAQAIGYKELLGHLRGEETLAEAAENLKTATRRYAKRQLTWFSAKPYVRWVDMERDGKLRSLDEVCDEIVSLFRGEEGSP